MIKANRYSTRGKSTEQKMFKQGQAQMQEVKQDTTQKEIQVKCVLKLNGQKKTSISVI